MPVAISPMKQTDMLTSQDSTNDEAGVVTEGVADDVMSALKSILQHLEVEAAKNPLLRAQLQVVGQAFLNLSQAPLTATADEKSTSVSESTSDTPQEAAQPPATSHAVSTNGNRPSFTATGNGYSVHVRESLRIVRSIDQSPSWRLSTISDDDLPLIAERCRLKAEGARWAGRRQQLLRDSADYDTEIEPHDRDIIARAKMLPDCFLWMCHRDGPSPDDLTQYETLAGCFEAAADAVALLEDAVAHLDEDRDGFTEALELAAEAQSALRICITDIGGNTDSDQYKIFQWLKQTGSEQQILIRRHMRKDDPADPAQWQALREGIQRMAEGLQANRGRAKRQRGLFSKIRYHLKLIDQNRGQDRIYDWQKVCEAVEDLVDEGVPPSNRDLRDLLLPLAEEIPDALDLSKNTRLVLRELDEYLSSRVPKVEESPDAPTVTEEVRRAAALLEGQTVVLIGGINRPLAAESLKQALALRELVWVEGRDQTYADFEPYVARPDVAVVILAIRWSRHGFGEVKEFCDKYDKPLVRLPGGYSPNQVALHIMSQVAERLAEKAALAV
mgnify:CR=1 FL=1